MYEYELCIAKNKTPKFIPHRGPKKLGPSPMQWWHGGHIWSTVHVPRGL